MAKKEKEKQTIEEIGLAILESFEQIAESISSMEQSLADIAAGVMEDGLEEEEDDIVGERDKTLD